MKRVNTLVWGLLIAFGAFIVHQSLGHSYYGSDFGPGPGFFSFWLGILLIVLSVIQLVTTYRRPAEPLPDGFIPSREGMRRILSIMGALAASLAVMNFLGFALTMTAFCIFLLRSLGRQPWWQTLILSALAGFGMAYLFGLLQVMLPKGFLGFI
ncbi:MAG: tripartite tricarboxylate transporter TctB family protein [Deltaproteobacteria bacterium]|nr:tripartite tricarboxylate transporter TctB family protein [Deltaproteobacteria bacterium]